MTTLKSIRQMLKNWIEDDSIDEVFENFIQYAITECESTVNFSELFDTKTVAVTSGIFTEPARCREITEVYPETTTGYPAFRFEFNNDVVTQDKGGMIGYTISPYPAWDTAEASHAVDYVLGSGVLAKTSGTFFAAADVGKRVMIAGCDEFFEVVSVGASTAVVSPVVPLATGSGTAQVNPAGTKRFLLKTPTNEVYEGNVTVHYQKKHPLVYSDNSLLLIPCAQSVALIALQQALMTNKYEVDAQRLDAAVIMAKNRELDRHSFKTTKNSFSNSAFSVRSKRVSGAGFRRYDCP